MLQQGGFYLQSAKMEYEVSQVLDKQEVRIYETFIGDSGNVEPLYVQCQGTFQQWVGICIQCGNLHDQANKFVKQGKAQYQEIPQSQGLTLLDQNYFVKTFSQRLCQMINDIPKNLNDKQLKMEQSQIQKYFYNQTNECYQIFVQEFQSSTLYKKFKDKNIQSASLKQIKCSCPQQQQQNIQWNGFCSKCKATSKHQLIVLQGQSQIVFDILDLRFFNFNSLQSSLLMMVDNYIQNMFIWKLYERSSMKEQESTGSKQQEEQENKNLQNEQNEQQRLIQEIQDYKNQLSKMEQEQKELENRFKEESIQDVTKLYKQKMEQQENLYDVEIDCSSLLQLISKDGWRVKVNEHYNKQIKNNTVVVSLYGLYNKGKSFLASKLSAKTLNYGYSVSTVGLSALYPRDMQKENSIVFLDTAGTETPISYHKKDELYDMIQQDIKDDSQRERAQYETRLKDRLLTENLIQQFILKESNIILVIVDQLTKEEQKLIQKIKQNYVASEIIIVHNFSKLIRKEHVEKYIQIDIMNSFLKVEKQFRKYDDSLYGYVYIEEKPENNQNKGLSCVTHVVMAQDESAAGDEYNAFCYRYLKNRILTITNVKIFDIIQKLQEHVKNEFPRLIEATPDQLNKLQINFDPNEKKIICNAKTTNLRSISFDILGDLKVYNGDLAPKYSITLDKKVNPQKLVLEVEIAGQFQPIKSDMEPKFQRFIIKCQKTGSSMFEWHGFRQNQQHISIRGEIIGAKSQHLIDIPKPPQDKPSGEFKLVLAIDPVMCVLRDTQPQFTFIDGVARLEYGLLNQFSPDL
ncbi:hypothetical protein pb186bvf_003672 [Paramecium bursaria]